MIKSETTRNNFRFDTEFKTSFDSVLRLCDSVLQDLSKLDDSKFDEYGICVTDYSFRYITPEDVSTYISNLVKLAQQSSDVFKFCASELDMFTVASIKKFVADHDGVPFESSTAKNRAYVNPRNTTIQDLMLLCQNDVHEKCVCSSMDIKQRISDVNFMDDVDTLKKMHFPAVMRNIAYGIPDVLNKGCPTMDPMKASLLMLKISEFLMFTVTLMTHTANEMVAYVTPIKTYKSVVTESADVITECCLLKTNTMNIRSKIPFDCNLRNVVLQDMHPYFADTRDAILFIMNDDRSPIKQLVTQYASSGVRNWEYDVTGIIALAYGSYRRTPGDGLPVGDMNRVSNFHTDLDWLHGITFGNNYMNGNYRRDAVGNNKLNSITTTLSTIYSMFSCDKMKTNEELADNIVRISSYMLRIIQSYLMDQIENHEMVRDILCVLGECMTRSMIRLYDNNSHVLTYDVNMEDTQSPGYSYMEAFVMEADGDNTENKDPNKQPKPEVTNPNAPKKDASTFNNIKQKLSEIIRRFTTWIREKLSNFPAKWTRDHAMEVKWINGNKELNDTIGKALDEGTFTCTIAHMPNFKIPAKDIVNKASKLGDIINVYLDGEKNGTPIDDSVKNDIKSQIYPLPNGLNISQVVDNDNAKEIANLTNLILFSSVNNIPNKDSVKLQKQRWDELINDLTQTGNLIQTEIKACVEGLTSAMRKLDQASKETDPNNKDENGKPKPTEKAERAGELFKIVQEISQKYTTLLQNVIARKFYAVEYNMYRDIIKLYKQQVKDNNSKTEPPVTGQQNNQTQPNQQQ